MQLILTSKSIDVLAEEEYGPSFCVFLYIVCVEK